MLKIIHYRVFQLGLYENKHFLGHQNALLGHKNNICIYIFKKSTLLASTTSERKVANTFTGGGRGAPMMMPLPHPSGSK